MSLASFSLDASSVSLFNASSSICNCMILRRNFSIGSGIDSISVRSLAAASSTKSIALSGRNLSEIYLSDNTAAETSALSRILTP